MNVTGSRPLRSTRITLSVYLTVAGSSPYAAVGSSSSMRHATMTSVVTGWSGSEKETTMLNSYSM